VNFIHGKNRNQIVLIPECLDNLIAEDNDVRMIDLFVDSLNIADYQFITKKSKDGRPAYNPKDLLKLYIYGYLNSIRSSRKLEKECHRNIEVMWLMKQLAPDHNTISNFRRDNSKAIKKVFRATVQLAQHFQLIGGKLVAGDSTKLRAQNSKKNNFNPKKIQRHLEYIDAKLEQYNQELSTADGDTQKISEINENIAVQEQRKEFYNDLSHQLEQSGETQISTSDPESRQLITRNNITEVAYNVQSTVDDDHKIQIDFEVTNENDSKAMGVMLRRSKSILRTNDFTALYDKGYHTGSEIRTGIELGIDLMVAIPAVASHAPDLQYDIEHFTYNSQEDCYICPEGQKLNTNGNWYNKHNGKTITQVKHYKTNACLSCPAFEQCTKNKKGRLIERTEHAQYIEQNKKNIENNPATYRKRQAIVEHPYGVLKRQWGFYYVMTKKGKERASADVGLMFVAYNLRRIFNIIGPKKLKKHLRELLLLIFAKMTSYNSKLAILKMVIFNPSKPQYFLKVS
jgi:transposase